MKNIVGSSDWNLDAQQDEQSRRLGAAAASISASGGGIGLGAFGAGRSGPATSSASTTTTPPSYTYGGRDPHEQMGLGGDRSRRLFGDLNDDSLEDWGDGSGRRNKRASTVNMGRQRESDW